MHHKKQTFINSIITHTVFLANSRPFKVIWGISHHFSRLENAFQGNISELSAKPSVTGGCYYEEDDS